MGGNNELRVTLDIVFIDSDDDDSSMHNGADAPPPREQSPPPLTDASIASTTTQGLRVRNTKRRKYKYGRVRKEECNWWRLYLSPEALQAYRDEPDGRLAREFCRMFRMSYDVFKRRVLDLTVEMLC